MTQQAHTGQGMCIALEGTDGTGKSTQCALLYTRLQQAGFDVVAMKFPRYNEPSSYFVRQYLAGAYGDTDAVNPHAASLFFSLDRYHASFEIRSALAEGKIVLCDRFTGSNMIHQGAKLTDTEQRHKYLLWLDDMERKILDIPKPTVTVLLTAPFNVITERLAAKSRSSTHVQKDIHEADLDHIRRALDVSLQLCDLFPQDFIRIDSVEDGDHLSPDAVHARIWDRVQQLLSAPATAEPAERHSHSA